MEKHYLFNNLYEGYECIIMIKSSDKNLDNTYRILRVLSNQDYLAVDQHQNRYIFTEIKVRDQTNNSTFNQSTLQRDTKYLLRSREAIHINNLQYGVFDCGHQNPEWAAMMTSKQISNNAFITNLVRQAIQKVLSELVWIGNNAKNYLDLRNFWLIGEQLYLLMIVRNKPTLSIKRSQRDQQTLQTVIDSERNLMKQFALILWQICFQSSYFDQKVGQIHSSIRAVLISMIKKTLGFEEIMQKTLRPFAQPPCKARFKTINNFDIFQRRKTISNERSSISNERPSMSKERPSSQTSELGISRIKSNKTQQIKVQYVTPIKHKTIQQQAYTNGQKHSSIGIERRSMSQDTYGSKIQKRATFRQSKFQHSNISRDTIYYESWLQRKKYSHDIREKLLRNSQVALQKFMQSVKLNRVDREMNNQQERQFKERILSKVIKFKNAFKNRYTQASKPKQGESSMQTANAADQSDNEARKEELKSRDRQYQISKDRQYQISKDRQQQMSQERQQSMSKGRQYQINNDRQYQISKDRKQMIIKDRQQQNMVQRIQINQIRQRQLPIQNEYRMNQQFEKVQIDGDKTQKKKLKRIDIIEPISDDLDLQVVNLQQTKSRNKMQQILPKPKLSYEIPKLLQEDILWDPVDAFNQYLMLINTLGDITVRAVKNKQKLADLRWRIVTYFLYQRFQIQRRLVYSNLRSNKIICRANQKVGEGAWVKFTKSEFRQNMIVELSRQNEQISTTLNRLGGKLLEEQQVEQKLLYFIKNRQKLMVKNELKLRRQLSQLMVSTVINEFDYVVEERIFGVDVVHFIEDCVFGMQVIAQLDGVLSTNRFINLDDYKQYRQNMNEVKPIVDHLDSLYFPKGVNT